MPKSLLLVVYLVLTTLVVATCSPAATTVAPEPTAMPLLRATPSPTSDPPATATSVPTVTSAPTATTPPTETPTPVNTSTASPTSTSTPQPQVYITTVQTDTYASADCSAARSGFITPEKQFTILDNKSGCLQIKLVAPGGVGATTWIKEGIGYGTVAQVAAAATKLAQAPTPTLTPFPNRTGFRKTGQFTCQGLVRADPFYQMGAISDFGGNPRLGARVLSINYQTQIITVDAGNGKTIQVHTSRPNYITIEETDRKTANCSWRVLLASVTDFETGDAIAVTAKTTDELRGNVPGIIEALAISGLQ